MEKPKTRYFSLIVINIYAISLVVIVDKSRIGFGNFLCLINLFCFHFCRTMIMNGEIMMIKLLTIC